ncbi:MAG: PIG-L family deacetylase [Candidatus Pacebacteria bacterium]|nr:PIG-L family deacetylase [Candidatus Paceibacterota bacterium]
MPSKLSLKPNSALFLLPHRDDEFGIYSQIDFNVKSGNDVVCIYFTQNRQTDYDQKRNLESLSVLQKLGVKKENVIFPAYELELFDLELEYRVAEITQWLKHFLKLNPQITQIFVPAWEGGHPDHDIVHGIIVQLMAQQNRLDQIRQFSLYHNYKCPGSFFRVQAPLAANGPVEKIRISWSNRIRFLFYCLHYPTQTVTFIGLFPFIFIHHIFYGCQYLQKISVERLKNRPMPGKLYYEVRQFSTYERVAKALAKEFPR